MTKVTLKLVVVLGLLTAVSVVPFLNFASANPYQFWGEISGYGLNFVVTLNAPANSSVFTSDSIPLALTVGIQDIPFRNDLAVTNVEFVCDWLNGTNYLNQNLTKVTSYGGWETLLSCNTTLQGVPEGNHTLTLLAHEYGFYYEGFHYIMVYGDRNATVNFVVDYPPIISFLASQNQTYPNGNVTLNFAADKPLSNIVYSLDNQDNTTAANTSAISFVNLSEGEHNVTITAKDALGVASAPATVVFNVNTEEPAPSQLNPFIASVIALAVAAVIVLTGGLFLYRKRRSHQATDKSSLVQKP